MTRAQQNLERPVSFRTAAKKLAAIRGAKGGDGGWIYNAEGRPLRHGWDAYGRMMVTLGLLVQDAEHDGGDGKWYVWVIGLSADELQRAEALYG